MDSGQTVATYEALAAITGDMLAAACAEDWELLAALEARRSEHVQALKEDAAQEQTLSGPQRGQVIEILRHMLADDLGMRELGKAKLAALASLINSAKTERKLSDTYV